jgi:hypothetical protein
MLGLSLALILATAGVMAFPCWRYSAAWGYGPSALAGGLLLLVAVLTIGDRAGPHPQFASPERTLAPRIPAVVAKVEL